MDSSFKIDKLNLRKLCNTRDLGGFPTADGRTVKYGKLIRSGRLYNLPDSTKQKLRKLFPMTVIDLRTDKERQEHPSDDMDGMKVVHLPLVCTATVGITHETSMAKVVREESKRIKNEFGNADNYMKSMYEIILFEEGSVERLKKIFGIFLESEGSVLWHCNAGKDRTGIVAMLLESLLGVDEDLIIADYVASDYFQRRKRSAQKFGLRLVPLPSPFRKILFALMYAKREYIVGAMDLVKERCGSVIEYCKTVLELTDDDIERLKAKYLD